MGRGSQDLPVTVVWYEQIWAEHFISYLFCTVPVHLQGTGPCAMSLGCRNLSKAACLSSKDLPYNLRGREVSTHILTHSLWTYICGQTEGCLSQDPWTCLLEIFMRVIWLYIFIFLALVVKNPPANAGDIRDVGLIFGSGRSLGEGNGNPLQYSCIYKGTWQAILSIGSQRVRHDWNDLAPFHFL